MILDAGSWMLATELDWGAQAPRLLVMAPSPSPTFERAPRSHVLPPLSGLPADHEYEHEQEHEHESGQFVLRH